MLSSYQKLLAPSWKRGERTFLGRAVQRDQKRSFRANDITQHVIIVANHMIAVATHVIAVATHVIAVASTTCHCQH